MTLVPAHPPSLRALVRGAGPTGAVAALALADAGWDVTLVDPAAPARLIDRRRAYAFTHSSRRLLMRLGVWVDLCPALEPFEQLALEDGGTGQACRFGSDDLWGSPTGLSVGWIGDHETLMGILLARLRSISTVQLLLGSPQSSAAAGNESSAFDLIVAADGSHSPTRESLAIGSLGHAYGQHCLTAQVRLRGLPPAMAWERLRPEGPFALLPMPAGTFQVVWSAPAWRCHQLESLSASAFLDALAPVLPLGVEAVALEEGPRVFPVGLLLAQRLHKGRTILVGETAHRCHPVGGQGLNLSWRDVAVLHQLAQRVRAGRLPSERLGGCYARRRWADLCLTLLITDGLVRLFSNRHPLLLALRRPALQALARGRWLRRCLLGAMTHGPCQAFQRPAT